MPSSLFSKALNKLKEISKASVQKHKEILFIFRSLEGKFKHSSFHSETHRTVTIDFHTYENLIKLSSQLIDLDERVFKNLIMIQDSSITTDLIMKKMMALKFDFESMKKKVLRDFDDYNESCSKICSELFISELQVSKSQESVGEKLKSVLKSLVYPETLEVFIYQRESNVPVRLQSSFYKDLTTEEPELELNSKNDNKRLMHHISYLTQSLELVTESLLKILIELPNPNNKPNNSKSPDETKANLSLTPSELQNLMQKISKLHSRGSLTDEEARNMIGKISEIPISPPQGSPELDLKGKDLSIEVFTEDCPINLLPDKSRTPTTHSISRELQKRSNLFRKITKRVQTPNSKIGRNTSLPKASALVKFQTQPKSKHLKLKAKSPHSFLYI